MAKKKRQSSATHAVSAGKPHKTESSAKVSPDSAARSNEHSRSSSDAAPAKWRRIYALVPAVLALLTSINSLANGFAFDDGQQVLANESIKRLSNLPLIFTNSVWAFDTNNLIVASSDSYYRPLFMSLFSINYAIFGTTAWGWHLVNALIHVVVTLMIFFVLKEVTERPWLAAIAAGLFAVHPAHSESVAWISGITDPLMALFVLPVFYLYLRFRKTGRKSFMVIALVLFLPALLSKETALALPLVIAYCELFYFRDSGPLKQRLIRAVSFAAFFIAPAAVYFLMRYIALSRLLTPPGSRFAIGIALATMPAVVVKYLGLMLIPLGYNIQHYIAPAGSFLSLSFLAPLVLLVAITVAVWLARSRILTFAGAWFIIWLLPPLVGLRSFLPQYFVQERYLYLPSIGICLALALGIEWLATRRLFTFSGRQVATAVASGLLIVWSVAYINQNRIWNDTLSLFRHCVAVNPDSTYSHIGLSTEYYVQGMRQEGEGETRKALELDANCLDAIINLSQFAYNAGKIDAAIEYLEHAQEVVGEGPQRRGYLARIYHDLGQLYDERKNADRAEGYLKQAVDVLPYPRNWFTLGNFYFDKGRYAEALDMYELTQSGTSPKYALLHLKLGRTYDRLGQVERARDEYNKYLDLAPNANDRSDVFRRLSQL
jgi:tetratricopeptide (TPR) repeat protein